MSRPEDEVPPELAQELARRARDLARVSGVPVSRPRRAALRLEVGSDRVLLAASAARTIAPLARVTPIPFAAAHVVGLTARRGRAIPVFSLGALLGLPVVELPEATRVVVLDAPGEPALAVDAVFEDDLPDDEALRPAPDTMASDARALVRGTTGDGRLLLDVEALLASPRLTIDVGPRAARRG